jgi:hypothetical protein
MPIHPTDRQLNRFADRELPRRWQALVARHLEGCARCRERVMGVRALGRAAKALTAPPLPPRLRRRVLDAAAGGRGGIIPLADPRPRGRRWQRFTLLAAAAGAVAMLFRMVLAPGALRSEASALRFEPAHPAVGDTVRVNYRATPRLAGEARLRLRARFRRQGDAPYGDDIPQVEAAILERDGDGTFRSTLPLPPGVVYAAFAVEDQAGARVDGRGRLGFELLTYADSVPSYRALMQRAHEALRRDLRVALQTVEEATALYPDSVQGWHWRGAFTELALGPAAYDSLSGVFLPVLERLDAALSDRAVDPETANSMYLMARRFEARDVEASWKARLVAEASASEAALRLRALDIVIAVGRNPARAFAGLERLWNESGKHRGVVADRAYLYALDVGDPEAALRWATRLVGEVPAERLAVARGLVEFPSLGDTVLAWLGRERAALAEPDERRRALYRTVRAQRDAERATLREVMGLMGRIELAQGNVPRGVALLDSAAAEGWDLTQVAELADALLAAGDVRRGVAMLARLAADPAYGGVDDAAARALALVSWPEWAEALARAEQRMREATMAEAGALALPDTLLVADLAGDTVDLGPRLHGRVTVVAVIWPGYRNWYARLGWLEDRLAGLSEPPEALLVSTTRAESADIEALRAAGVSLPLVVDAWGAYVRAVDEWSAPTYYVIDAQGVVRFGNSRLEDVPRQVLALRRDAEPIT